MPKGKIQKNAGHGGERKRAGRKPRNGGTVKFCVSVTASIWHDAEKLWIGNRSQLVDHLLRDFVAKKATA